MKQILVLAYHFPPIGGGGVQRNTKFVRYLPDHEYAPVVLTGPGRANDRWTPTDETLLHEVPDSTVIARVPGPEPETGAFRAAMERRLMLQTPFTRWWIDGSVEAARTVRRDVELVYASVVPYASAEAAVGIARDLGLPWIADLQDPWALDEMWLYPSRVHRRVDMRRMRRLLSTADAIVMNTPEAARRLQVHFPELRRNCVLAIPNGFDSEDFRQCLEGRQDNKFRIVHTGYLHTDAGLGLRRVGWIRRVLGGTAAPIDMLTRSHVFLVEAINKLVARDPSLACVIEVVLAGVLSDADRQASAGSSFVRMPGYLPHDETVMLLRTADLLFLPMHDLPPGWRAGLVPGKTYEYLAAGPPILAAVPDGDARDLLAEAGNALLCRPSDSDGMADILAEQIRLWQAGLPPPKAKPEVLARYERRRLTEDLAAVFDAVLSRVAQDRPGHLAASTSRRS
jgi:glycosyltransferase involved in cell wall biosynthesis